MHLRDERQNGTLVASVQGMSCTSEPSLSIFEGCPLRVLLAEDDDELRESLSRWLAAQGCEVTAVGDGASLLDCLSAWILRNELATRRFDVIITDVRMPGFSGLSIAEGLHAWNWPGPIVVMSALDEPELIERVRSLRPLVTFVAKPFDPDFFVRFLSATSFA